MKSCISVLWVIVMKTKINVLSLFDGMSCGRIALERADIQVNNYYSSEIDKWAIKVADDNWPQDSSDRLGDITDWKSWDIDWSSIDLILAGSPCQGFSFAGKQLAFDDPRSALFFTFVDILNRVRNVNPDVKFLLENVKMKESYIEIINELTGVTGSNINSDIVSAQQRSRYYWCNWSLPDIKNKSILFQDILDKDEARIPKAFALTRTYYKGGGEHTRQRNFKRSQRPIAWISNNETRHLTPVECERLQTVPDNYTSCVSNTQRYKMLGNGWTIDVIVEILKGIKDED